MSEQDQLLQEGRLKAILEAKNIPAAAKARQITRLGFDPEIADQIVERHQLGNRLPEYYESLNFADIDEPPRPSHNAA